MNESIIPHIYIQKKKVFTSTIFRSFSEVLLSFYNLYHLFFDFQETFDFLFYDEVKVHHILLLVFP